MYMLCLENLTEGGLLLMNLIRRITDGSLMENETPWISRSYVSTTSTFPKVSIHKGRGRARLRFGQRDILLGKAGSREAENSRLRVHAAWVKAGGKLPDDFTVVEDSPVIPIPARKSPEVDPNRWTDFGLQ